MPPHAVVHHPTPHRHIAFSSVAPLQLERHSCNSRAHKRRVAPRHAASCSVSKRRSSSPRSLRKHHAPEQTTSMTRAQLLREQSLHAQDVRLFDTMTPARAQLFARALSNRSRHFTFVLDGVQGPHNLAAIVRSCDAYGIQDLHIISNEYPTKKPNNAQQHALQRMSVMHRFEHDQSVRQVSKGCHKWLTISEYDAINDCVKTLKNNGYRIIVSSLSSSAKPLSSVDLSSKCAFVFGNERYGVTALMNEHADELFTIPMMGFVESMNVSVAVATTACLIMHHVSKVLPACDIFLSAQQRRELAHSWLTKRRAPHAHPKLLPTKRDMTRLGERKEAAIIARGLFSAVDDHSVGDGEFWRLSFRLAAESGVVLCTYLAKRKFGALGDKHFARRCETICDGVAGTHAVSFEAVRRSRKAGTTRNGLLEYFKRLCRLIGERYERYFDREGMPLLPLFAAESEGKLEQVHDSVSEVCYSVCLEVGRQEFALEENKVNELISTADAVDFALCIVDTIRCNDQSKRAQFVQLARQATAHKQQALQLVRERHATRKLHLHAARALKTDGAPLDDAQRDALQAMLRLAHAAWLCSETHRAAWRRESNALLMRTVHSPTSALLERVLCEAFAEMTLLECAPQLAVARLLLECEQTLAPLRAVAARHAAAGCQHDVLHQRRQ